MKDYLSKKSQWIFGGDGWAYDIGYGGVDHVSCKLVKISISWYLIQRFTLIQVDSLLKLLQTGATATVRSRLVRETKKKDLAMMAMSYGYVYVAQIAMGADFNQTVKAIAEAEAYPGPSLNHRLCSMYQPRYQEGYEQSS